MDDQKEEIKKVNKAFRELEICTKTANERLRMFLKGLAVKEMIVKIRELGFSDRSLNYLCEGIALEHEDFEICIAVEEIKKERALKKKAECNGELNKRSHLASKTNPFNDVFQAIKHYCGGTAVIENTTYFETLSIESHISLDRLGLYLDLLKDIGLIRYSKAKGFIQLTEMGVQKEELFAA